MMKANLKKYLQSLFMDASDTPNNDALFEELLGNLYDRYDELIGEGLTPDAAYARAIGDLGDISPLIEKGKQEKKEEAAAPPPPFYETEGERKQEKGAKKRRLSPARLCTAKVLRGAGVAAGVMLYILWLVLTVLFEWVWPLFVFAALGTAVIVLTCNLVPDFADDSEVSYAPAARRAFTLAANLLQAFGIGFCILCVLPAALIDGNLGAALMFAIVALGVGMIIFASAIRPRLDEELEDEPKIAQGQWYEKPEPQKKKRNWIIPVVVVCAVLVLIGVGVFAAERLSARFGFGFYNRTDPARYTNVGDVVIENEITRLSVEWDVGSVTLIPYDGETVKVFETSGDGKAITDSEEQLRWYVENGHLRIRFDGKRRFFHWGHVREKHLTVQIPADFAPFSAMSLDAISATVSVKNLSIYGTLDIETVSGDVTLEAVGASATEVDTVSGNINAAGSNLGKLAIDTVSGVTVCRNLTATDIDFSSVSGNMVLENALFATLEIDTTSGDVHVKRHEGAGFIAELDSTSGEFNTALAVSHSKGYYRYGDESMRIEMDSVSGDLTIE